MVKTEGKESFHIMICLIQIWEPKGKDIMTVPSDVTMITEVQSIEIEESYKKLIGTAHIKFPRGTVIRQTVTKENEADVAQDNSMQTNVSSTGVIEEVRTSSKVANVGMFSTKQRIKIMLGYTDKPEVAELGKVRNKNKNIFNDTDALNQYTTACKFKAFDGWITKISVDSPIELHCENLASGLKKISCPKKDITSKATVKALLGDDGPYKLLKGTGLKLHPKTKAWDWNLGRVKLHPDLSVADVLTEWAKFGMHSFVAYDNDGNPCIAVGRAYFDKAKEDSVISVIEQPSKPPTILFDYNVAENGLTLTSTDKRWLAIEAKGVQSDMKKFFNITVMYNPEYDPDSDDGKKKDKYRIVNETKLTKKQIQAGAKILSKATDKVDMKMYNVQPYTSRKIPVTKDELFAEAVKYLESYNMNGIEGSLTLFGDLGLHTGVKVRLQDDRYPGKNGDYVVEEVKTTFGTNGYRQTIKLPYCLRREKQEKKDK